MCVCVCACACAHVGRWAVGRVGGQVDVGLGVMVFPRSSYMP